MMSGGHLPIYPAYPYTMCREQSLDGGVSVVNETLEDERGIRLGSLCAVRCACLVDKSGRLTVVNLTPMPETP